MAALRALLELLRGKLLRLDGGVDDDGPTEGGDSKTEAAVDMGVATGVVREACAHAAGVYMAGQRALLQLGIAECKARLYAAYVHACNRHRTLIPGMSLTWCWCFQGHSHVTTPDEPGLA